jgi:putative methyltransferase (TIGR04325 family)
MEDFSGLETYPDYESALKHCGEGYADRELAEVTLAMILAVLPSDLKVALHPPNTEATLTALQLIPGKEPHILDFGGSFGPHYFLAKQCLPKRYRWAVVETETIVSLGERIANDELRFFTNIEAAREWLGRVDIVHASGSLQCTPQPKATLETLVDLRAPCLALGRTAVALGPQCVTIQVSQLSWNGPGALPRGIPDRIVKYPRVFMAKEDFVGTILPHYRLVFQNVDDREPPLMAGGVLVSLGDNFIFVRRDI